MIRVAFLKRLSQRCNPNVHPAYVSNFHYVCTKAHQTEPIANAWQLKHIYGQGKTIIHSGPHQIWETMCLNLYVFEVHMMSFGEEYWLRWCKIGVFTCWQYYSLDLGNHGSLLTVKIYLLTILQRSVCNIQQNIFKGLKEVLFFHHEDK